MMKLTERVHLVGSGNLGFDLTDPFDCHIFLVDGGSELALVDVGAGMGAEAVIENVRRAYFDPGRIRHVILTHAHGDHGGGAARMTRLLDNPRVYLSRDMADALRNGDEEATSLDVAKQAGLYPPDYRLEPCAVDVELAEGDSIAVGDLSFRVYDTPGHCDGHVSLLLQHNDQRILFAGDAIFFGGKIFLQNIHDCRLQVHIESIRKLRGLEVTALLSGHLALSLRDGQRHIDRANDALDRLVIPQQIF